MTGKPAFGSVSDAILQMLGCPFRTAERVGILVMLDPAWNDESDPTTFEEVVRKYFNGESLASLRGLEYFDPIWDLAIELPFETEPFP